MLFELLLKFIENFLLIIKESGYIGIFLGMALESSFIPFPSEIILVPAGALVARNEMSFLLVFFAGVFGSIIGALVNYFLALYFGRATIEILISKYRRLFFINKKSLVKSDEYFENYGEITTFVGRLIPVIRQLISLPAGFSRMNLFKFILFTSLGAGIWAFILIIVGYFFGSNIDFKLKLFIILITLGISLLAISVYLYKKRKK